MSPTGCRVLDGGGGGLIWFDAIPEASSSLLSVSARQCLAHVCIPRTQWSQLAPVQQGRFGIKRMYVKELCAFAVLPTIPSEITVVCACACACVCARSKRKEGRKKNIPAALPLVLDSSHRVRPWNCLPPSFIGVRQEQEQSSDGGLRLARPRRRTWRPRPWAEIDGTVGHRISLLVKLTSNVGETDEDGVLCPESESSPLRSKSVVVIDQFRRCLASAELLDDELGIAVHVDPFRRDSRPLRRVQRHC